MHFISCFLVALLLFSSCTKIDSTLVAIEADAPLIRPDYTHNASVLKAAIKDERMYNTQLCIQSQNLFLLAKAAILENNLFESDGKVKIDFVERLLKRLEENRAPFLAIQKGILNGELVIKGDPEKENELLYIQSDLGNKMLANIDNAKALISSDASQPFFQKNPVSKLDCEKKSIMNENNFLSSYNLNATNTLLITILNGLKADYVEKNDENFFVATVKMSPYIQKEILNQSPSDFYQNGTLSVVYSGYTFGGYYRDKSKIKPYDCSTWVFDLMESEYRHTNKQHKMNHSIAPNCSDTLALFIANSIKQEGQGILLPAEKRHCVDSVVQLFEQYEVIAITEKEQIKAGDILVYRRHYDIQDIKKIDISALVNGCCGHIGFITNIDTNGDIIMLSYTRNYDIKYSGLMYAKVNAQYLLQKPRVTYAIRNLSSTENL